MSSYIFLSVCPSVSFPLSQLTYLVFKGGGGLFLFFSDLFIVNIAVLYFLSLLIPNYGSLSLYLFSLCLSVSFFSSLSQLTYVAFEGTFFLSFFLFISLTLLIPEYVSLSTLFFSVRPSVSLPLYLLYFIFYLSQYLNMSLYLHAFPLSVSQFLFLSISNDLWSFQGGGRRGFFVAPFNFDNPFNFCTSCGGPELVIISHKYNRSFL